LRGNDGRTKETNTMKTLSMIGAMCLLLGMAGVVSAAQPASLKVKAGDVAYVCNCGPKCACGTVSLKEGKCGCGHDLVKVTVTQVKGNRALFQMEGKERNVKLTAKLACACGSDCCQMISDKPGKCACGKELAPPARKK
jgi:hypothetical protein